jgi:hypothetical protein
MAAAAADTVCGSCSSAAEQPCRCSAATSGTIDDGALDDARRRGLRTDRSNSARRAPYPESDPHSAESSTDAFQTPRPSKQKGALCSPRQPLSRMAHDWTANEWLPQRSFGPDSTDNDVNAMCGTSFLPNHSAVVSAAASRSPPSSTALPGSLGVASSRMPPPTSDVPSRIMFRACPSPRRDALKSVHSTSAAAIACESVSPRAQVHAVSYSANVAAILGVNGATHVTPRRIADASQHALGILREPAGDPEKDAAARTQRASPAVTHTPRTRSVGAQLQPQSRPRAVRVSGGFRHKLHAAPTSRVARLGLGT